MIASLRGRLAAVRPGQALVEVGGVGYLLQVPASTLACLPAPGEEVRLHTVLQVREDALHLFGFATGEERELFELLLTVNGVGPRLALAALSALGPAGLAAALAAGDAGALTRVPGIGARTAQRLLVELGDRVRHLPGAGDGGFPGTAPDGGAAAEAAAALQALGWSPAEAARALAGVAGAGSAEELVRQVLRRAAEGR